MSIEGTEEMEMLALLTERVEKAIELIKKLRKENETLDAKLAESTKDLSDAVAARKAAEKEAADLKKQADELEGASGERVEEIESELEKLKDERAAVRKRVESVLEKLESLEGK